MIKILLYGVEIVTSFLLILVILAQRSKGSGGLGGAAFGGMGESIFGSRAGNFLTKATILLGSVFLLNTLGLTLVLSKEAEKSSALAASIQVNSPAVSPDPATTPAAPPGPAGVAVPAQGGVVSVPVAVDPAVPAVPAAPVVETPPVPETPAPPPVDAPAPPVEPVAPPAPNP